MIEENKRGEMHATTKTRRTRGGVTYPNSREVQQILDRALELWPEQWEAAIEAQRNLNWSRGYSSRWGVASFSMWYSGDLERIDKWKVTQELMERFTRRLKPSGIQREQEEIIRGYLLARFAADLVGKMGLTREVITSLEIPFLVACGATPPAQVKEAVS